MGGGCSMGCCGERIMTEVYVDPMYFQDSQSYRANFVHQEPILESIEQVNLRGNEFDEMDKIYKLLDNAEQRIIIHQTVSSKASEVSNKPLQKKKGKGPKVKKTQK